MNILEAIWRWLNKGRENSIKEVVLDNHIDTIKRNISYYVDELRQVLQQMETTLKSQGYVNGLDFFIDSEQLSISPQLWKELIFSHPHLVVRYLKSLGALDGIAGAKPQWKISSIYMEMYERWADYVQTVKGLYRRV